MPDKIVHVSVVVHDNEQPPFLLERAVLIPADDAPVAVRLVVSRTGS